MYKSEVRIMFDVLSSVKDWFCGINYKQGIAGAVISFFVGGLLKKLFDKYKTPVEEDAFKKALKRWKSHEYLKGYYKKHSLQTINDYCAYVINHGGDSDQLVIELYGLFEAELQKSTDGRVFLQNLRQKTLYKEQYEALMKVNEMLVEHRTLHQMLDALRNELKTHNKGQRVFDKVEGYIERYCTLRLKKDELFNYLLLHEAIGRHKLIDIVSGKTDFKGNKFVLYSDAQTGKTTELLNLGWELQQEGKLIPIMFRIRGCQDIKQELPALSADIEKGLVAIIDALDEKFDGNARLGLYHEIETYAREHPDLKIVVTCRENFSKEFSFEGFTELSLNDLSWNEAIDYLIKAGVEGIIEEIEGKSLFEFVRTPFYLQALVDYYKEKHTIPENKGDLYEFFIEKRLHQEEGLGLRQNSEMLTTGRILLQKMAVAMQLMGENHISKDELLELFDKNYEDYNRIQRTGLLEIEDGKYGFSHNSFKEYFVAKFLLDIGNLERVQNLCCYKGTRLVRNGWYNTVALLLSQLPQNTPLSKQIMDWIAGDNKELVLYIDRKLFDEEQRSSIFKEIIEWHKLKSLRIGDLVSRKYEDLMAFGRSKMSFRYLISELKACEEIDCHLVNILFLIRYLRIEDLTAEQTLEMRNLLLTLFEKHKNDEDHVYIFFEVFRSPWFVTEETVDNVFKIEKDAVHPEIVNHLIEYLTETGYSDKYIDEIVKRSKFICDYPKNGVINIVRKDDLHKAYESLSAWESIRKALDQLKEDYLQHRYTSIYEEDYVETLEKLLTKISGMIVDYPEVPDYVYNMLSSLAEDGYCLRHMKKDPFREFFVKNDLASLYFDKSFQALRSRVIDGPNNTEGGVTRNIVESNAYCAALLLDDSKLNEVETQIDDKNVNWENLLGWLWDYSNQDIRDKIDLIRKKHFPKLWKDRNSIPFWQVKEQQEYDELMDYVQFKNAVLKVVQEKAPKNREDLKALRKARVSFSDEEVIGISRYVLGVFNDFYYSKENTYDLEGIRKTIEDFTQYQRIILYFNAESLYSGSERISVNESQKQAFKDAALLVLKNLALRPYGGLDECEKQAINVLLHHDVILDRELLLRLLPYSSLSIHLQCDRINGLEYSLFNLICEQTADDKQKFLNALRSCMNKDVAYPEENWKEWGVYLIDNKVSSEYVRIINQIVSMKCADPSLSIIISLLGNEETRPMLLKREVMEKCDLGKREFIYSHLASEQEMDAYVLENLERDFDKMDDYLKKRAFRILLTKGSIKGLKYAEEHIQDMDMRADLRNFSVEALPLLMSLYSKAVDSLDRSDYPGIMNAVESMALANDEGWEKVEQLFEELIRENGRKYQHLNWYLRDWSIKRMEKSSPLMTLKEAKSLFESGRAA